MTEPPPEPPAASKDAAAGARDPRGLQPPEDIPAEPVERRYPSTIGGAFYLAVLGVSLAGFAVVFAGDWRLGVRMLAGALCVASVLRILLPARDAGMLAVRSRWLDAVILGGVGATLFFLAATIPDQPL